MMPLLCDTTLTHAAWNGALAAFSHAHILQSWEWGAFKAETTGWQPHRLAFRTTPGGPIAAMASVGVRRVGPLSVAYAPRGPVVHDWALWPEVLTALEAFARRKRAVWLKCDPDRAIGYGVPGEADEADDAHGRTLEALLRARGWRVSGDQVQFRNSIVIDLTQGEDALLAAMSQSTRRKVRVAEREGVRIRAADSTTLTADLATMYALYQETGARDGFLIRPAAYYEKAWRTFLDAGLGALLIAERDGQPLAAIILFRFGQTAWYFYGASSNQHRDAMPNYLLQWDAMRWAAANGCTRYDLWGAPNVFAESDPMWGVYAFKRGFRGTVVRGLGAWDYAPIPPLYHAYTRLMPRVLAWMRRGNRTPGTLSGEAVPGAG
jgi:lipid II:glycine glycyltransferase (peptidoglycan interpeptide bridge formation enzyme)